MPKNKKVVTTDEFLNLSKSFLEDNSKVIKIIHVDKVSKLYEKYLKTNGLVDSDTRFDDFLSSVEQQGYQINDGSNDWLEGISFE